MSDVDPALDDESDIVADLEAMAEIIDLSVGKAMVAMLSGSMFAEAAAEITRLEAVVKSLSEEIEELRGSR
jgi:hypothetical protein